MNARGRKRIATKDVVIRIATQARAIGNSDTPALGVNKIVIRARFQIDEQSFEWRRRRQCGRQMQRRQKARAEISAVWHEPNALCLRDSGNLQDLRDASDLGHARLDNVDSVGV